MTLKLWRKAGEQFFDNNGNPLNEGQIHIFEPLPSTNRISLYLDKDGTTPLTNPVVLDSSGRIAGPVYIEGGVLFREAITNNGINVFGADEYLMSESGGVTEASEFALSKTNVIQINDNLVLADAHKGYEINCDPTSGDITVQLGDVWDNGDQVLVRNIGTQDNVLLSDLKSTFNTIKPGTWARIVSDGAQWIIDQYKSSQVTVSSGFVGEGTDASPLSLDQNYLDAAAIASAPPHSILAGKRSQAEGGESSTGNTYVTRYLNTKIKDHPDVTLNASIFTISRIGMCSIRWEAPGFECGTHQANLKDIANDAFHYGSSPTSQSGSESTSISTGIARLDITEPTDFSVEHKATESSTNGFGVPALNEQALFTRVEVSFE